MILSVIFVNYNSTQYVRDCIASIYRWTTIIPLEIIVIDNASTMGDIDTLQREFDRIILLRSSKNLGFARANNVAYKHSSGQFIMFLNPDTRLISPAIDILVHRIESLSDAGILGCKLLNGDLSVQTSCIQTFPTILNQVFDTDYLRVRWPMWRIWGMAPLFAASPTPAVVEAISGACMLIKRQVFEEIGMFSECYFMYAEDMDLCYKAKRAGYRNYFIGTAELIHYGGKSSTSQRAIITKWESILRYLTNRYGRCYTALFRIVLSVAALSRILCAAFLLLIARSSANGQVAMTALRKWSTILRTLRRSPLPAATQQTTPTV